ncbi:thioredoxin-like protein [Gilbertella persicaria]|uniref:Thioredoxin n=1 Tax=Rhizopus stolonifer TaxID=4846 RepID=A0A367KME6_RHIST|nr:thioredoxin-like protein [Gilbertella persicaria]KAI8087885.1 thioredoxin-like protein [Gilbertella persicaria]RCI03405.1 Cytoplasmic thioredoxin isoenzyme 2 [Rhizopus stolonifer]
MSFQEPKSLSEFQELINQDKLVVVDFHATWCGPCKLIAPKLKNFAEAYTNVVFAKVDVDEVPDVAGEYQVRAMPTIMYFKNGQKLGEVVGANIKNIEDKLKEFAA